MKPISRSHRGSSKSYMKTKLLIGLALVAGIFEIGCNTTQQRVAYNSIFSVEQAATATVDCYYALVIKGVITTNNVPTVSQKFNQLQAACTLAAATSQAGTNALAPAALTAELGDLTAFVLTLEPPTK